MASILLKDTFSLRRVIPAAERIFELARSEGLGKRELRSSLAKTCGISPQAVRDWEEGKTKNIKLEHLIALSRRFQVSLDYLLTGDIRSAQDSPEMRDIAGRWSSLSEEQRRLFHQMIVKASDLEDSADL